MLHKVKSFIETGNLLHKNAVVVVGFSGGADSVVLLHLLKQLNYRCIAAHCNFHLRMEESNRDEQFVRTFCKAHKIELHTIDFDTVAFSKSHGISIEMAARELRYNWFEEIRIKSNAEAIAVAHHADDNAETLLLNLVRGTGIRGITGIRPKNGNVIRPLLCVSRNDIEKYAQVNSLDFVTDSTNSENEYQRNKIRNIIMPYLAELNPAIIQTLNENAKRFENTFQIYQQFIHQKKNELVEKNANEVFINIELLKSEPEKLTLLYEFCREYGFHSDQITAIIHSLDSIPGKIWHSETHRLTKDRKHLIISKLSHNNICEVSISKSEIHIFEPINLIFNYLDCHAGFEVSRQPNRVHIDASLLEFPLTIRKAQVGDSFIPFGMKGRKKISDFFTDLKLNTFEKESVYLLLSGNEIVWVIGLRTDNRFRITDKSTKILEIVFQKNE